MVSAPEALIVIESIRGVQPFLIYCVIEIPGFGWTKIVSLAVSEPQPNTDETTSSTI